MLIYIYIYIYIYKSIIHHNSNELWFQIIQDSDSKNSSSQNVDSVINYSPSWRLKPVRPSFIFGTQIKIFDMHRGTLVNVHRREEIVE